jgi:hypothetical protein
VPLVFNFALSGSGPVRELLALRRLFVRGICPSVEIIEVFAPYFTQAGYYSEEINLLRTDAYWSDLAPLAELYPRRRWEVFAKLVEESLSPGVYYRSQVLHHTARFLLPPAGCLDCSYRDILDFFTDGSGWMPLPDPPNPEEMSRRVAAGRGTVQPVLDGFQIDPIADGAMRRLLAECREHGTKPVFLLMPEQTALRDCYTPAARLAMREYLAGLLESQGIPVIDARSWVGDDRFMDFFHLSPAGADAFSERFGRLVLRPLLQGTPLHPSVLFESGARMEGGQQTTAGSDPGAF